MPRPMVSTANVVPQRVFLDTGVIIEGCFGRWGAAKGMLVLMTDRRLYTVVLAEAVERELERNVAFTMAAAPDATRDAVDVQVSGWLRRVRLERHPLPAADVVAGLAPTLMPVVRHRNDVPAIVSAVQARPDWVVSTNTDHWNADVAARTSLRILTPQGFLSRLRIEER